MSSDEPINVSTESPSVPAQVAGDAPVDEAPKARRGRPRKAAVTDEGASKADGQVAEASAPKPAEKPARKPRATKPKAKPAGDAADGAVQQAPVDPAAPAAEPADDAVKAEKPRRGRPRKATAVTEPEVAAPVDEVSAPAEPTAEGAAREASAPAPRPARTRKSKAAPAAAEASATEVPSGRAADADPAGAPAQDVESGEGSAPEQGKAGGPRRKAQRRKPADQPTFEAPALAARLAEDAAKASADQVAVSREVEGDSQEQSQAKDTVEATESNGRRRRGRPRKDGAPGNGAEQADGPAPAVSAVEDLDAARRAAAALLQSQDQQEGNGSKEVEPQAEGSESMGESRRPRRRDRRDRSKDDDRNKGERGSDERGKDDRKPEDKGNGNGNGGKQDRWDRQRDDDGKKRKDRQFQDRKDRHKDRRREFAVPKTNREELEVLNDEELWAKAEEHSVPSEGITREELLEVLFAAMVRAEGFFDFEGILDIGNEGSGSVRVKGYLPSPQDILVPASMVRTMGLRRGDHLSGVALQHPGDKRPGVNRIQSVNGLPPEQVRQRPHFGNLTPVFPTEPLVMEHGKDSILGRCIDLVSPIGKGQRGLIVSPPKAGKTTVLKKIAESIAANNPEVHLICLLVDERPEEVTDMQRSINGEVVASTFDMPCDNHITVSELVIERAKRLVELGQDVVILLDSITRLARAYNLAQPASGRILSGGVDSTALYPPKRFLGAARNIEGGGSLTILASALVDTGSKMDEVIFEEFKGTGNMELKLDRDLADRRIFPAIDPVTSGTRKEELLLDPQFAPLIWGVRRVLANFNNSERAMTMLIKALKATENNQEFLIRSAKKSQGQGADSNEL